jgi:hypothetical protein
MTRCGTGNHRHLHQLYCARKLERDARSHNRRRRHRFDRRAAEACSRSERQIAYQSIIVVLNELLVDPMPPVMASPDPSVDEPAGN